MVNKTLTHDKTSELIIKLVRIFSAGEGNTPGDRDFMIAVSVFAAILVLVQIKFSLNQKAHLVARFLFIPDVEI